MLPALGTEAASVQGRDRLATYGLGERTALWPSRWPLIALQECVDQVEAAPPETKTVVRFSLPCATCPKNTACLTAREREVGSLMFDREYLTRPRASASSLFPFERIEPCLDKTLEFVASYRKPYSLEYRFGISSGWDIAWSERTGGDYLVKLTGLLDRQSGKKRLLDAKRWQAKTFDEQMDLIQAEHSSYRDDIVVVEDDFSQKVWVQRLTSSTSVPVIGHSAGAKTNLEWGIPALLMGFDRQVYQIPWRQGSLRHDLARTLVSEFEAFGWEDDKLQGVGEHDDMVMAFYHMDYGLEMLKGIDRPVRKVQSQSRGVEI